MPSGVQFSFFGSFEVGTPVPQAASSTTLGCLVRSSRRAVAGWLMARPRASASSSKIQS